MICPYYDQAANCTREMSSFGLVSLQTQHLLTSMLSDESFVENFQEERRRLAKRQSLFVKGFEQDVEDKAGLFVWMDLHRFMKELRAPRRNEAVEGDYTGCEGQCITWVLFPLPEARDFRGLLC